MAKTIHLNLSDELLLAIYDCYDLVLHLDSSRETSGPIVKTVLSGFINSLQKKGTIPKYDNQKQITRMLNEYLGISEERTPATILDSLEPSLKGYEEMDEEEADDGIRDLISQAVSRMEDEQFKKQMQVDNDEPVSDVDSPTDIAVDFSTMPMIQFEEAKRMSPKDILIQQAVSGDDKLLMQAIEYGYAQIPQSMWGSDNAISIVQKIKEQLDDNTI